jgi:hypothetical protein
MTLPYTNLRLSAVNTELGRTSTQTLSMNDAGVRVLGKKASGTISMGDLRGRSLPSTAWTDIQQINWRGICASTAKFVAVGDNGYIGNSTNAFVWTVLQAGVTSANLTSVAFSSTLNLYMAVGDAGMVLTSTDGVTWVRGASPTNTRLEFVVWVNNLFVTGGAGGIMYATTNATSWATRTTGTVNTIRHCAYSPTLALYIYVADGGVIASSPNTITWTGRGSGHSNRLSAVVWSGSFFSAVGNFGRWNKSTDGITWTTGTDSSLNLYGLVMTSSTLIACGGSGTIKTSTDGATWTVRTSGKTVDLNAIAYNATALGCQAVGLLGAMIQTGLQGINWNNKWIPYVEHQTGVTYANGQFVFVGNVGNIFTSPTGEFLTPRGSSTSALLNCVIYGGGKWLAAGGAGALTTSTDNGVTWTATTVGAQTINCLAYGNGVYVMGADNGKVRTSPDGITWTDRSIGGVSNHVYGATYNAGLNIFVICGQFGLLMTSSDNGVTWVTRAGTSETLFFAAFAASRFIVGGAVGTILTSTNATTWTQITAPSVEDVRGFTYSSELNLACVVGAAGTIYTTGSLTASPVVWSNKPSGTSQTLNGIAWGNPQFMVVGNSGTFLES